MILFALLLIVTSESTPPLVEEKAELIPPYDRKMYLLKRRFKDLNEKALVIQLAGLAAESNAGSFKKLGFQVLTGKKVDSETRVHFILQADIETKAELATGQGRPIEEYEGAFAVHRALNLALVILLQHKIDWASERYTEIDSTWDKFDLRAKDKDYDGALEVLDAIQKLDPEDKAAGKLKEKILVAKEGAGVIPISVSEYEGAIEGLDAIKVGSVENVQAADAAPVREDSKLTKDERFIRSLERDINEAEQKIAKVKQQLEKLQPKLEGRKGDPNGVFVAAGLAKWSEVPTDKLDDVNLKELIESRKRDLDNLQRAVQHSKETKEQYQRNVEQRDKNK